MSTPKFSALTFIGPGEDESRRLATMTDSLIRHEPNIKQILIIDDDSSCNFQSTLSRDAYDKAVIVRNPRLGAGDWWQGGLCAGLTEGLRLLAKGPKIDFVIRIDSDALVIAPFSADILKEFTDQESTGLLGTWNTCPRTGGQRLPHPETTQVMQHICHKLTKRIALWRHTDWPERIQCIFRMSDRIPRRTVIDALKSGYRPGDFVQGGGYAISSRMIRNLDKKGLLRFPTAYLKQLYGEDHLATIFCYAAGLSPADSSTPIFGIMREGLPCSPQEAVTQGYRIIHSIKNDGRHTESEIVSFFQSRN